EVYETMDDLLKVGCRIMTIGQYLQPTLTHTPVMEYITPIMFEKYRMTGISKGFEFIESAPFVRSSYHAEKQVKCQ
ncbi:MAG TPA: lipoyl synthase, partial [Bacteroidales bacterium]|nr:lipoyl synthase [Bacteroidales bacterium]